jgi:NitT/TauT family transport system ATP-binding protein
MMNKLIVKNLEMKFNNLKVIDNISFEVAAGEFVSIVGPSGCGKTTLLYLLNKFIEPAKGVIETNGKAGFIFQDHCLLPWKTALDNVLLGIAHSGNDKKQAENKAKYLLKQFGLPDFADYYPCKLSEGMKQRIGIARCLIRDADIVLLDEPFRALDYFTKLEAYDFITAVCKEKNITAILVTHDIDEAIKLSDRIIVLSERPARIKAAIEVNKDKEKIKKRILSLISSTSINHSDSDCSGFDIGA